MNIAIHILSKEKEKIQRDITEIENVIKHQTHQLRVSNDQLTEIQNAIAAISTPPYEIITKKAWVTVQSYLGNKYPLLAGYLAETELLGNNAAEIIIGAPLTPKDALSRPQSIKAIEEAVDMVTGLRLNVKIQNIHS